MSCMTNEAMELFESLTRQEKDEVLSFMKMSRFWRKEQMFRERFWWLPAAISFCALVTSLIAFAGIVK